ncbi:MAG: response regulator [Pseudomonadota bacterium]
MSDALEDLVMLQPPTADRPLLGTIVLVVEDSRHACEGLRLICQRSGARIRRAESLASAERHLRTYRPRVAVIDLGLPDGSGLELISKLAQSEPRIDGIIATSGDETLQDAALKAGADVFLPKPLSSISHFQQVVLDLTPANMRPNSLNRSNNDLIIPDPIALRDDLGLAADMLRSEPDHAVLHYVASFLTGLAKNADDPSLAELGEQVRAAMDAPSSLEKVTAMVEERARLVEAV